MVLRGLGNKKSISHKIHTIDKHGISRILRGGIQDGVSHLSLNLFLFPPGYPFIPSFVIRQSKFLVPYVISKGDFLGCLDSVLK